MASADLGARDVFGVKLGPAGAVMQVFQVRRGRVVDRVELVTEAGVAPMGSESDVLTAALSQFYETTPAPPEIVLPADVEDAEAIETWLSERAGRKVRLVVPQRGDKKSLLELASRNAGIAYDSRFNAETLGNYEALETLRGAAAAARAAATDRLLRHLDDSGQRHRRVDGGVRRRPHEEGGIQEVPDTTTTTTTASATTARATATSGDRQAHGDERERFLDDFAAMQQVVERRYRRVLEDGGPFPDLIVIDGGKGQLEAAYEALESLGLANLVAIGLAKKEELIFQRDERDPLALASDAPALLLLQRIRDEAHRFAITFHRASRSKRTIASELDGVPGLGPRRRRLLLQRFGSVSGVRRATREELESAVGAKVADAVLRHFQG